MGISARAVACCSSSSTCGRSRVLPRRNRHSCNPWSAQTFHRCWQGRGSLPSRPRSAPINRFGFRMISCFHQQGPEGMAGWLRPRPRFLVHESVFQRNGPATMRQSVLVPPGLEGKFPPHHGFGNGQTIMGPVVRHLKTRTHPARPKGAITRAWILRLKTREDQEDQQQGELLCRSPQASR